MTPAQQRWLEDLARKIREPLASIEQGNSGATYYILGTRQIGDRTVHLIISVEVINDVTSPMATHGIVQLGDTKSPNDRPVVTARRPRKRPRNR